MLPTPSTSHTSFSKTIYEPAEDSFLLLNTLSSPTESAWLQTHLAPQSHAPIIAEIGTGSGVVVGFLAAHAKKIFGRDDVLVLGADVNMDACTGTKTTVREALVEQGSHSIYLASICADLCGSIRDGSIDVLVLNPPYVPTDVLPALPQETSASQSQFEMESHLLSLSYAGGRKGMETTDRLLNDLPRVLSPRGVAYVMFCAQNEPEEVKMRIDREWSGKWRGETVGRSGKMAGWEKLEILRISRQ